jgi:excisionase family DNA binding protein
VSRTASTRPGPATDGAVSMLRVRDVATQLGISRSFAYDLIARGELPAVRVGRRLLVPEAAVRLLADPTFTAPRQSLR